ncbi:MAG: tail fiber domain-containing protein [Flavobacteriales bacterium]|nr:tail fiber domain-containing protein [Flavobacteriales bacterium]
MKPQKLFLLAAIAIYTAFAHAQTPQGINYQAVITDTDGKALSQQSVTLRLGIYSGISGTIKEYEETHIITTSEEGLVNTVVGQGSVVSGNFGTINWGGSNHFLKIEVDKGQGFVNMGSIQLQSVPYSFYSSKAAEVENLSGRKLDELSDVNVPNAQNNDILRFNGTNWVPGQDQTGANYSSGTGIDINGSTLSAKNNDPIWNAGSLQGRTLSSATPANGDVVTWNGSVWTYTAPPSNSYNAGSGLSLSGNTFTARAADAMWNANKIYGNQVSSATPQNGEVLKWDGSSWAPAADGGASYNSGTGINIASGTISATNTTAMWNADKLQGNDISAGSPSANDVLKWDGSKWVPGSVSSTTYSAGTGISIASSIISANTGTALWNSNKLQGRDVSSSAPATNDVLKWDGSKWAPAKDSAGGGGSSVWSKSGNNIFSGANDRVGINRNSPGSRLHVWDSITSVNGISLLSDFQIYARSNSSSSAWAVRGWTNINSSALAMGLIGVATGSSSVSNSTGVGVFGYATSASGSSYGGQFVGEDASIRNYGVYSESNGTGSLNVGGLFISVRNSSNANYGLYSIADSASTAVAGYFDGDLTYTGTLTGPSDQALKTRIEPMGSALNSVLTLRPKTYEFRDDVHGMRLPEGTQYGFIAQELETVFPNLVKEQKHIGKHKDGDPDLMTYKSVDYISLIPVLTKAIQEQQAMIEALQLEIQNLKTEKK